MAPSGKQTPAPKASSERKSPASEQAKKSSDKSDKKETYPKPLQRN